MIPESLSGREKSWTCYDFYFVFMKGPYNGWFIGTFAKVVDVNQLSMIIFLLLPWTDLVSSLTKYFANGILFASVLFS